MSYIRYPARNPAVNTCAHGVPSTTTNSPQKPSASGMLTDGGITRRSGSLGWSWWTPWMIQWKRAPGPDSGSKWNTIRWIQYSISVQNSQPMATRATVSPVVSCRAPSTKRTPTTGRKISGGTAGWTRESRSRRSESNILGEAFRTSVRRASTAPEIYRTGNSGRDRSAALPETAPRHHQVLQPERGGHAIDDDLRRGGRSAEEAAQEVTGDEGDEEKPADDLHRHVWGLIGLWPSYRAVKAA